MNIALTHTPCPEHPATPWLLDIRAGTLGTQERFESEECARSRWQELASIAPAIERVMRINRLLAGTGLDAVELIEIAGAVRACSPASRFSEVTAALLAAWAPRVSATTIDRRSPRTLENYEIMFGVLDRHFGEQQCEAITPMDFHALVGKLKNNYGKEGKASTLTKRTYLGTLRMVLLYAGVEDPLKRLPKFNGKRRPVAFYTVARVKQIFAATPEWERAVVAIATFGLIPWGVACQLTPRCINFTDRTITIPAEISPDHRKVIISTEMWVDGRYLPGLPVVLWKWLELYVVQPAHPIYLQVRLKRATGFWLQGGLLRTMATYYCAAHDEKAVEAILGHAGEMLTTGRFVGETSVEEAEKFLALDPSKITFEPAHAAYGYIRDLPRDEFERLLWLKPMPEIAKDFNVSTNTVFRYAKDLNIPRPIASHWAKLRAEERRKRRELEGEILTGKDAEFVA